MSQEESGIRGWVALVCFVVFILLFLILNPIVIIGAGQRGVLLQWGKVQDEIFGEGLHFITPVMNSVAVVDIKTQKYEAEATAASKDLQDAKTTVALNYHLEPSIVNKLYQEIGIAYESKVISPAIQEVVKASTAKFNAEELITKRSQIKDAIEEGLKSRLNERGMIVEAVSITNFEFSAQFSQAIESKVTAQQLALKAENDLQRIKIEAEQKVAQAKGESESIRIIQEQLKISPDYIRYLSVLRWNGIMPMVIGGAMPFVQIPLVSANVTV
jgi:regulator of protease activity HflC (stomatin/prohibitin superfamily)